MEIQQQQDQEQHLEEKTIRSVNGTRPTARCELPVEMQPRGDFSVWSILKNCVGKELTRVAMPVSFNEPLSFLQRICEYLEYSELLFQAERCDSPVDRLELIAAFAVSAASSNWDRLGKPFNPLLGETFELDRSADRGFRMVCEQVSHHPPVSAFHAEATDGAWSFHGSVTPRLSFWGKSVEVSPRGHVTLEFPRLGEVYTWQNVQCKIHNIIVGKLWIEHFGDMCITCHSSGSKAELSWHLASWLSPSSHRVDGYVYNASRQKVRAVYGKWVDAMYSLPVESWKQYKHSGIGSSSQQQSNGSLKHHLSEASARRHQEASSLSSSSATRKAVSAGAGGSQSDSETFNGGGGGGGGGGGSSSSSGDDAFAPGNGGGGGGRGSSSDLHLPGQRCLWQQAARPESSGRYYSFTEFAMQLNDCSDAGLMARLPPTDSRRKPDVRALEAGDPALAQAEKTRLEDEQRRRAAAGGSGGGDGGGLWFRRWRNPHTKKDGDWRFTGDYWARDWSRCPGLF